MWAEGARLPSSTRLLSLQATNPSLSLAIPRARATPPSLRGHKPRKRGPRFSEPVTNRGNEREKLSARAASRREHDANLCEWATNRSLKGANPSLSVTNLSLSTTNRCLAVENSKRVATLVSVEETNLRKVEDNVVLRHLILNEGKDPLRPVRHRRAGLGAARSPWSERRFPCPRPVLHRWPHDRTP